MATTQNNGTTQKRNKQRGITMKKLKIQKKELNAYKQFKKEIFWKKFWHTTRKVLFCIGIVFFFLLYALFYFGKICKDNK